MEWLLVHSELVLGRSVASGIGQCLVWHALDLVEKGLEQLAAQRLGQIALLEPEETNGISAKVKRCVCM
jgi:hypothetical protein